MFLIGAKYKNLLSVPLQDLSCDVLWLPDNPNVDKRLSGHADLMAYASGKITVLSAHLYNLYIGYLFNNCGNYIILEAGALQDSKYPNDCRLCVCSTGKYDIYNPQVIDPAVKNCLTGIPIEINQGYAACSVCVINENAIITSDPGIAAAMKNEQQDVLKITPGHIVLEGFDYGFIGGASFLLDAHRLAFTGKLDEHPDKDSILQFLKAHNIKPVYLTDAPIFDIGGAIKLP